MLEYLIEHVAGAKGDLIATFLNGFPANFVLHNRTIPPSSHIRKFMVNATINDFVEEESLREILKSRKTFVATHELTILEKFNLFYVLKEENIKVKKIKFDKKYYRTISIEGFVKNLPNHIKSGSIKKNLSHLGLKKTRKNQAYVFEQILNDIKNKTDWSYFLKFNKLGNIDREFWDYQDLYVDFKLDDPLFQDLNKDEYKRRVDQSWTSNEIEAFGEKWDLRNYGYLQF